MTTFLLIRHAAHSIVSKTLVGRTPGIHLSDAGQAQAAQLAQRLSALTIHRLYSSPLERAQQTAAPIGQQLALAVETHEALNEIDFGAWAGRDFDDLAPLPQWQRWNAFRSGAPSDGGESMLAAQARIVAQLQAFHQQHNGHCIAIVSHCDLLKAALAYYLGVPLDLFQRIEISPASISILELSDYAPRITRVNDTGTL